MQLTELNLFDQSRSRSVPILVYTPENLKETLPIVIFSPGYQEQERLKDPKIAQEYKVWDYLAEYFTNRGYAFISI